MYLTLLETQFRELFSHDLMLANAQVKAKVRCLNAPPPPPLSGVRGTCTDPGKLAQVTELESLFEGLRSDVDALFMQTPSVDQEGLCRQSEEMHRHLEEQARRLPPLTHVWTASTYWGFCVEEHIAACALGIRGFVPSTEFQAAERTEAVHQPSQRTEQ